MTHLIQASSGSTHYLDDSHVILISSLLLDTPKKRKTGANGFIEFLSEFRKKDAYSGLHQKEISVIAGQEWNKQSQEVKELYRVRKLAKLSLPDVLEQNGMEGLPEKAKTRARKRKARPKKVAQEALVPRPSHTHGSLMEPEVPTPLSVLSESTPGMTDYSSVAGSLPPTPAFVESYVVSYSLIYTTLSC